MECGKPAPAAPGPSGRPDGRRGGAGGDPYRQGLARLLDIVGAVGAALLAASLLLPVEKWWSPLHIGVNYAVGTGPFAALVSLVTEAAPYVLGLVLVIAAAAARWPRVQAGLLIGYASIWAAATAYYGAFLADYPMKIPLLWGAAIAVPLVAVVVLLGQIALRLPDARATVEFGLVMTGCSILQQCGSVTFFLLEDGMLLNFGVPAGLAGAAILFVSLLVKRKLLVLGTDAVQSPERTNEQA